MKRLESIFEFLAANRTFNKNLQKEWYRSVLCIHGSQNAKIINLLYAIANTQSQPRIDHLANFFRSVYKKKSATHTFTNFVEFLTKKRSPRYIHLYEGLTKRDGWGPKTAALFAKSVYHAHTYGEEFAFWPDAPKTLEGDELKLPVDAVIIRIFEELHGNSEPKTNWTFDKINKILGDRYTCVEMEI